MNVKAMEQVYQDGLRDGLKLAFIELERVIRQDGACFSPVKYRAILSDIIKNECPLNVTIIQAMIAAHERSISNV